MTEPLKISQAGQPLTCDEHDDNLDRLRDRANHTGTQSCATISDLDVCLATSSTITNITSEISTQDTRIGGLETALQSGGSIQTDLQNLQNDLENQVNTVQLANGSTQVQLDALEVEVDANRALTNGVNTALTINIGGLDSRMSTAESNINSNDSDITLLQSNLSSTQTDLNTEASQRSIKDNDLQAQITAEVTNRNTGDTNLSTAISVEESQRITSDSSIQGNLNVAQATLQGNIDIEESQRIAADNLLEAQLNAVASSISDAIPTGVIMMWVGAGIPSGFQLCDATALSRTTFSSLFNIIGTTYGTTNSTNFLTPNFNGRFPVGMSSQTVAAQATATGGDSIVQITEAQMPSHTHTIAIPTHQHNVDYSHDHHLFIHPHTHSGGTGGTHNHAITPPGGSGTSAFFGDDAADGSPPQRLYYGRAGSPFNFSGDADHVQCFNQAASAGGAAISSETVGIYPPPFTGTNRTDPAGGVTGTTPSGAFNGSTGNKGSDSNFDNRPAYREVKFIIKT